jgi:hypothetical protein
LNEGTTVVETSGPHLVPALEQHVLRLVEERHTRTVANVVREPVTGSTADVNELTVTKASNNLHQTRDIGDEDARVGD